MNTSNKTLRTPKLIAALLVFLAALFPLDASEPETETTRIDIRDFRGNSQLFWQRVLDETDPGWRQRPNIERFGIEIETINKWTQGLEIGGKKTRPIQGGVAHFHMPSRDHYYMLVERPVRRSAHQQNPRATSPCMICSGRGYHINKEGNIVDGRLVITKRTRADCSYCKGSGIDSRQPPRE